jgi:hypothetical protein
MNLQVRIPRSSIPQNFLISIVCVALKTKSGGGGFGKPPPKPDTKKPERPNISQAEAANRLYQGLSTISTAPATNASQGYSGPFPPGSSIPSVSYDPNGGSITVPTIYQTYEVSSSSFSFGSDSGTLQQPSSGLSVSESNGYYVTSVDATGSMAPQRYIQPFRQSGAARGVLMAPQNSKASVWPNQQSYILEQQQPQPPSQYANAQYVTASGMKLTSGGAGTSIAPSNAQTQPSVKL